MRLLCDAGDVGCPFEVIREMKSKIFVGFGSSKDSFMDGVWCMLCEFRQGLKIFFIFFYREVKNWP